MQIDPVEYGMLVQQVAHLTTQVDGMKKDVQAMRNLMEQSKGGWRTLAWLGGIATASGGFIGWVLSHVKVVP